MQTSPEATHTEELDTSPAHALRLPFLIGAATLVLVATILVTDHERSAAHRPASATPSGAAVGRLSAPDVSLAALRHYVVTGIEIRSGAQVLVVDYRPSPTSDYVGGTITLYAAHRFPTRTFLASATRTGVDDHIAYAGAYHHQFALAWPVTGGRWICLTGFIGTGNGSDPNIARRAELTVSAGVDVR